MTGIAPVARAVALLVLLFGLSLQRAAAQEAGGFLTEEELFGDFEDEPPPVPDPLKPVNKAIFRFNDFFYRRIGDPVARTYDALVPGPVQTGVDNFFTNLAFPVRFAGNLLQGKVAGATRETGRFLVNTTAGIFGILTPADEFPHLSSIPVEDMGQVLGVWGFGEGFYVVIPFLGPSTARDVVGSIGDQVADPAGWPVPWLIEDWTPRLILYGIDTLNQSPELVERYIGIIENTIDPYSAVKDGYVQNRRFAIGR